MWRILERMARGEASREEVDMLMDVTKQIEGQDGPEDGDAARKKKREVGADDVKASVAKLKVKSAAKKEEERNRKSTRNVQDYLSGAGKREKKEKKEKKRSPD